MLGETTNEAKKVILRKVGLMPHFERKAQHDSKRMKTSFFGNEGKGCNLIMQFSMHVSLEDLL
jgi:hypothetical protein